jgi:hypothetical protein
MADHLYLRYIFADVRERTTPLAHSAAHVMWIEWKSARGRAAPHQKTWHMAERARGALVVVAGQDFHKSVDGFIAWYRRSGLMRKSL